MIWIARTFALVIVLAGIALALIYRAEINPLTIRGIVANSPMAPIMFIGLQIAASLLFVPRTVIGIAAGLVFGLVWGAVWSIIGAIFGAVAGFAFVRWMGARGTLETSPCICKLIEYAERGGWRAVTIVRLTPLPHSVANTALALTNISWRDYLLGSFVGMLPMTLVQVDIGAAGSAIFQGPSRSSVAFSLLAIGLAVAFFLKRVIRRNWNGLSG